MESEIADLIKRIDKLILNFRVINVLLIIILILAWARLI